MPGVEIKKGYIPGAIGRIGELHGLYYQAQWDFGLFFEAKVVTELSSFLRRYDDKRDGLWLVVVNGRVEGSIAIDGADAHGEGAHLRWFILSANLRGSGIGNQLIARAIDFCRTKGYPCVYLWTFEGLHAARHLYEKAGFKLVLQHKGLQWGTEVNEQRFELSL
jgi:GNAT superfamily N-acetyltransferase